MDRTAASHPQHPKTAENKNIVKYLKRATTFTVPTRTYSHGHDRGFSGPMAPLVPAEARRRGMKGGGERVLDVDQEPTSPKVSCIGQVKKHREVCMLASTRGDVYHGEGKGENKYKNKKNTSSTSSSVLSMIFKGKLRRAAKATEAVLPQPQPVAPEQAPSIGQMKRFTSGRDKLCGFDWKMNSSINGHDGDAGSSYFSADDGEEEEEEDRGVTHSGPTEMEAENKRKEMNLWQRRMARPPQPS